MTGVRAAGPEVDGRQDEGRPVESRQVEGRPEVEAGAEGAAALGGIMSVLAWVPRLVILHLAWVVLVLLGLVALGLAPATTTLAAALRRQEEFAAVTGSRELAAAAWTRYRRDLVAANRAALPFVIIALSAGANVTLGLAGALPTWFFPAGFAAAIILLGGGILSTFHAIVLHTLRPAAPAPVIWRGALAGPFLLPVATAAFAITLIATAVIAAIIQPVWMLCAGGILVAMTTYLLARPWQSRLETVTGAPRPAVGRTTDGGWAPGTSRGLGR